MSHLEKKRTEFQPKLPKFLKDLSKVSFEASGPSPKVDPEIQKRFPETKDQKIAKIHKKKPQAKPLKVGVVFSGGQAAGGHNVITGLFDALKKMNPKSELWGFLDGPIGIIENKLTKLTAKKLKPYRNVGGFDLIGSGRTKIESDEQFASSLKTANDQKLDGIVVIGGDDSNTNAALLAEYFLANGCKTQVIGVPKTIDGDLKNEYIEISFGFDTACKVYAEMIGNIGRDALSAKKYYHFVKLMGRSASHIALECALKTQPNWTFLGEEVAKKKYTLSAIAKQLADLIEKRSAENKSYGIILIPEGLIEFIPEVKKLIQELNHLLAEGDSSNVEKVKSSLSEESSKCLSLLPERLQKQFLLDRDPHGNVQVSHIETEKLLIEITKEELKSRNFSGKFNAVQHFFGYEGRAGFPSNFDAQYCYALGHVAALLLESGHTGYIACVTDLKKPTEAWGGKGLPITMFMNMETRHGKEKPVIRKALVELSGSAFKTFEKSRERWALSDEYLCPGPIQFEGKMEITDTIPISL